MKEYNDGQSRAPAHLQIADGFPPDFDVVETKAMIERGYRRFCRNRGLNFEAETFEGRRQAGIREAVAAKKNKK